MPVIAVINRKGGSGKTTLATHIAAWCAAEGLAVMLGDVDRQQSTRGWLRARAPSLPAIVPWAIDNRNVLRVPTGITHVVLDTPGGMHGFELARIVMFADAIVVPVCHSAYDRESAALCVAELQSLPRVATGRCRVATVGMRIDGRTRGAQMLEAWSDALGLPFLGALRDTQNYVHSIERGQTVFDLPPSATGVDRAQWEPLLAWMQPILKPALAANDGERVAGSRLGASRPESLMPQQESLVHGTRLAASSARVAQVERLTTPQRAPVLNSAAAQRSPGLVGGPGIPRFLKKAG